MPRRLRFRQLPGAAPFHAALVTAGSSRAERFEPHCHDFGEMLGVVAGSGSHVCGAGEERLESGTVVLVRPDDVHEIRSSPGHKLQFVNVAFPAPAWHSFITAVGMQSTAAAWDSQAVSPLASATGLAWERCESAFRMALLAYQSEPTGLDLVRFWCDALLPLLLTSADANARESLPEWLTVASAWLDDEAQLRLGLAGLLSVANVSYGHLARTTRRYLDKTPSQMVNDRRTALAATLLATSTESVSAVAHRSGFETLSHFYRCFGKRYGQSPGAYRKAAGRAVIPGLRATPELRS